MHWPAARTTITVMAIPCRVFVPSRGTSNYLVRWDLLCRCGFLFLFFDPLFHFFPSLSQLVYVNSRRIF